MKVKFSDITKYSKGIQIKGDDLIKDGEYFYLNGGINPSGKWNSANVSGDTVTISEGGNSAGYVNYMEKPFWCGAHCYYLFDGPQNTKYLYYALKSQQERLFKIRSGACMPNIKKTDLAKFEFNFDMDEQNQNKVVSVLSRVEDVITRYKKEIEMLDKLIRARFIEMFGDVPEEEKVTIAEICKIITDGTHQPPKFTDTGIPFLLVSNIITNDICYDAEKFISEETYAELIKRTPIEIGDILLSTVGSYGHPAIVKTDRRFCFQRHIAYLKPKSDMVKSEYLHGAILSDDVQRQIDTRVKGIAQKTLNLSEIRKIRLPLPPMKLQEKFTTFVAQTDKSKVN